MPKTERQVESNDIHGNITTTNNNTTIGKALNRRASRYEVASSPFAGRIGGNQEFVVTDQDHDASEVLKKLPDAVRSLSYQPIKCSHAAADQMVGALGVAPTFVQPSRLPCERYLANAYHRMLG